MGKHEARSYKVYSNGGDDFIKFKWNKAHSTATFKGAEVWAGDGDDTVIIDIQNGSYHDKFYAYIDGGSGDDLIDASEVPDKGNNSDIELIGGSGDDTIYGSKGDDLIYGDGPNTNYAGSDDYIESGKGDDTVYGGWGNDTIYSGKGSDTVYGGSGNDFIDTYNGDDVIKGGSGNDVIYAGEGSDTIDAGAGDDVVHVGGRDGKSIDRVTLGSGSDLVITGGLKSEYVTPVDKSGVDWTSWATGRAFVEGKTVATQALIAGGMAAAGSTGFGIAFGLAASAASAATLKALANSGASSIVEYAQQDYVTIADFDQREDVFVYTATSTSNGALDYFTGNVSSSGAYELWTDVDSKSNGGLIAEVNIDSDLVTTIMEKADAGSSSNVVREQLAEQMMDTAFTVRYQDGTYYDAAGLEISSSDLSTEMGNGDTLRENLDALELEDGQMITMTGAYAGLILEGEEISSANGNLYLAGTDYGDAIYAMNSSSTNAIHNAFLFGFGGDDVIIGGDKDDTLFGGGGDDTLTGNDGADTFYFEEDAGNDTITDFEQGTDFIAFDDELGLGFSDLSISESGTQTIISYSEGTITLEGTQIADTLTASDFIFA